MLELPTIVGEMPMMGVFNNLIMFDQHAPQVSLQNDQNFREVGLHQCPSQRKGEGVPVRRLRVPSHVPSQLQTAAKVRGFSPIALGFTAETDWLLEGTGFELTVSP